MKSSSAMHGKRVNWQLPVGVSSGTWDYAEAKFIAEDYDAYFAEHGLLRLDMAVAEQHLTRPGTLVDLGCGTGRALLPWVARGYQGIGVDLSQPMLEVLARKAANAGLDVLAVRGNMVEMDFLASETADYAFCLFSTLGMIQGDANRRRCLQHIARILKPGGRLVLHIHNVWHNLWLPQSRRWVIANRCLSFLGRATAGDKRYDYRGIRNFYLHVFTAGEIRRRLRDAGLKIRAWHPLGPHGDEFLRRPWLAERWRAQGWIIVAEKPSAAS